MATLIVDARVRDREVVDPDSGLADVLLIELEYEGRTIELTARADTPLVELAQMALDTYWPDPPPKELQKRYTVEAHQEQVEDQDGVLVDVWVVDSVTEQPLPGWADMTPDEAAAWIDTNVVDLDSAKTALKALCYRR